MRRRPGQLSGGQQQRVALARAIVFEPDILLLDEPLAALDRKLRESVRSEIRQLQKSLGITTILVTHDQDEALSMADQVITVAGGKVQQIDAPETMYRRPANRFVAEFLGSANVLSGELQSAGGNLNIVLPGGERAPCIAQPGSRRHVCGILRPEQIRLHADIREGKIEAVVEEVVFLGEAVRYALTSKAGNSFTARVSHPRDPVHVGSTVSLDWDPADVWILPEEQ
jgi:ABC-type Fe3+/spermidine/putrescine transport system ATPase subunit